MESAPDGGAPSGAGSFHQEAYLVRPDSGCIDAGLTDFSDDRRGVTQFTMLPSKGRCALPA